MKIYKQKASFANEFAHFFELGYVTKHVVAHNFVHLTKEVDYMWH